MKAQLTVLAAMILSTGVSMAAGRNLFTVDMTQANFKDLTLNLMEDLDGDTNGVQLQLEGRAGVDFVIASVASAPEIQCGTETIVYAQGKSLVELRTDVEIDDGSKCEFTVTQNSGRKATITFYAEGT